MIKVRILQTGKNKDRYIDEAVAEFSKRLGPYCELEIVSLKEVKPSKTFPREKCVEEEGWEIIKNLREDEYVIALDEKGKEMTSTEFAELLRSQEEMGISVCFVIGGAFGLSDSVKSRANIKLSFSKMTFTHQMIRLFLLEQIWRGICIIQGKEYHH